VSRDQSRQAPLPSLHRIAHLVSVTEFQAALGGLVHIDGPSRELVFDQAARFFRVVAKDRRGLVIAATLLSPGQGCRDGWTITVNADVSFAPTALGADCPISLIIGQPSEELSDTADELSDTAASSIISTPSFDRPSMLCGATAAVRHSDETVKPRWRVHGVPALVKPPP
jgi:hypothetical protein